uniref:Uncharacterized protein n=1 Tax=Rhizophora mucronata TaxID=61149 RepID=A0A2P2L3M7_RHIMU
MNFKTEKGRNTNNFKSVSNNVITQMQWRDALLVVMALLNRLQIPERLALREMSIPSSYISFSLCLSGQNAWFHRHSRAASWQGTDAGYDFP